MRAFDNEKDDQRVALDAYRRENELRRRRRWLLIRAASLSAAGLGLALVGGASCSGVPDTVGAGQTTQAATATLAPKLDPNTIPKFVNQLQRFYTYAPQVTRDANGRIIQKEYTVTTAKFTDQELPPGFPATPLFGYGGNVLVKTGPNGEDIPSTDGTGFVKFKRTSPGPKFEQTKGAAALIHYQNGLLGDHPLPVDPTLDWANPNNFPKPTAPFLAFPPGYAEAQAPIAHTTHTHGIEVLPQFDGTPDTWFTADGKHGPEFVSSDYTQPSSNQSAAFWYHDHAFGVTRLDVGMGLSGFSILRDPNLPLDITGNTDVLGFEDPYLWSSTLPLGIDSRHTQGSSSVSINAQGYVTLKSNVFALTSALGSTLSLDFFLPSQQSNPFWFGAVQLYADCPSKGVNNAFIGQVELTGKPLGRFSTLSFPVSSDIRSSIGNSCDDFDFSVAINVPIDATGTYLLDNLQGIASVQSTPLPYGEFEVPLILQERSFRTDGSIFYPTAQTVPAGSIGANPEVNPYWLLLNNGDVNVVNGKAWPNMNVKRHAYRFRLLNSSNQRFYHLKLSNGTSLKVIGDDGGYLRAPVDVDGILIGVTERSDFIIDFSQFAPGTKIVLQNDEQLQPPIGPAPDPNNDGLVMQFTVVDGPSVPAKPLPATLNTIATLTPDRPQRILIQNVQSDDEGRILQAELDGQLFHTLTTELPTVGSTEDWNFVNTTPLTHNKHVHLIEFQVVSRQNIDATRYLADWKAANGNPPFTHPTLKLPLEPYLMGSPEPPRPEESGWKDTVRTPAGQVTRIRIRWAPQQLATGIGGPGVNNFPFDPTNGIGYIWHCHLLEHEDNEMMRPMNVIPTWKAGVFYPVANRTSPGVGQGLVDFNGVDYEARVAHTSVAGQTPDTRPDLWARINNQNGDWAVQTIYNVGDRVFFQSHVYRALQDHQATAATEPDTSPAFWELVL